MVMAVAEVAVAAAAAAVVFVAAVARVAVIEVWSDDIGIGTVVTREVVVKATVVTGTKAVTDATETSMSAPVGSTDLSFRLCGDTVSVASVYARVHTFRSV